MLKYLMRNSRRGETGPTTQMPADFKRILFIDLYCSFAQDSHTKLTFKEEFESCFFANI